MTATGDHEEMTLTDSTLEASRRSLVADAEALAVFALANNNGDLASCWLAWADMVAAAGPDELRWQVAQSWRVIVAAAVVMPVEGSA